MIELFAQPAQTGPTPKRQAYQNFILHSKKRWSVLAQKVQIIKNYRTLATSVSQEW